jgi:CRP-like cAMP-binding protein
MKLAEVTKENQQSRNRILRSLQRDHYQRVLSSSQRINLASGDIIFEAGDRISELYFLETGMASLLSTTEGGSTIEVGMVGNEGFVGSAVILKNPQMPYRSMMQIPGAALKIKAGPLLEDFETNLDFRNLLLRYMHFVLTQVSQAAVCNRFHTLEERLCRWLLISRQIVESDELPLTQELLSQMLGVARTGVTMAVGALQRSGIIRHSRGRINILDSGALADASCECYSIVKNAFDQFLNS